MSHINQLDEVRAALEAVNERLLEMSMSMLSEAIEAGESGRPVVERQLSQARRSVERALEVLRRISND